MMWLLPLYIIIIGLLVYLTAATGYLLVLAVAYFAIRERDVPESIKLNRFAILVPAHNEELLISMLCENLLQIRYPSEMYKIHIIADNCCDRTAEICAAYPISVSIRRDSTKQGKGFAIGWAMERISLEEFDAILIVDADNIVDPFILGELNQLINRGERAIQCNNSVGNRNDSWFTQLLFVSRTIGNLLYHHSKYKLGLSSYLMGNGICFLTDLLLEKSWTAFSVGEDWEYYAQLIEDRIKIGFAIKAKVYHQESRSLDQATSQRLRWSSGRFNVLKKFGFKFFFKGLIKRDWFTLDASLPLIFPNYSLQFNLTILTLILCLLLPASALNGPLTMLSLGLICSQVILFIVGVCLAGEYFRVFKAVLYTPLFLIWKATIDFLSVTKIYRGDKWVRTERHFPSTKKTNRARQHS